MDLSHAKKEGFRDQRDFTSSRVQSGTPLPATSNLARLITIFIETSDTARTKLTGLSIIPPDNVITKIPEKERFIPTPRSLRFFSPFYVRGTRVLIFFTARLIFKGFFLFDDDSLDGLFFRILFRWIFEVS